MNPLKCPNFPNISDQLTDSERWHEDQLPHFVEWFARHQSAHYHRAYTDGCKQIGELGLPEEIERIVINNMRVILDADLDRCILEASELAARGMRMNDEPLY